MKNIVIIAHDMRSTHNVGSLLRTADGLGVDKVYLTGYTPYPLKDNDSRLPHIFNKLSAAIHKTALGAENTICWEQSDDITSVISKLKTEGYTICGLEQTEDSTALPEYKSPRKCALVLGTEVTGLPKNVLELCDVCLAIPMFGKKESFNVVQAAAMSLYQLRFH